MARRSSAVRIKPSFSKVLLDDFSNQLQIPPAFLVHFDGKVPRQSHLRTSAGTWRVNVEKVNDRFFFQKGWKKFGHDNDLKLREFLVFGYAGNSGFYVDIYGRDGCKSLSNQRSAYGRTGQAIIPVKDEVTVDTDSKTSMHPLAKSTVKALTLQSAIGFESEKPFFKVAQQKSYIHGNYLSFPAAFVKAHLTEQPCNATLRVSEGRTWPVNLVFSGVGKCRFIAGWKAFVRDNDLKTGDLCVFVLINKLEVSFKLPFTASQKLQIAPCHQANHGGGSNEFEKLKEEA